MKAKIMTFSSAGDTTLLEFFAYFSISHFPTCTYNP